MYKFFKIPLVLIIICSLSFSFMSVSAQETDNTIVLNPYFDINASELIVSGTVSSSKGSVPMVFTLKLGSKLIAAEQIITGMPENGIVNFSFTGVPFVNTTPSGNYEIYVSAGFIRKEANSVYTYDGPDKRFNALKTVNQAITDKNTQKLIEAFSDYRTIFVNGDETLFDISRDAKQRFSQLFFEKGSYSLPDDYITDENVEAITNEIKKAVEYYKEIIPIAAAVDIKNKTALDSWMQKYGREMGFYLDEPDTVYDEAFLGEYFDSASESDSLYGKIVRAAGEKSDFGDLKAEMLSAGILTLLEDGKAYKIQEITESIPELFTYNTQAFNKLSDKNKLAVYQSLENMTFDSIGDYIAKFNTAIDNNTSSQVQNNYGSGASGSGGGGGFGGGAATKVQTVPQDKKEESVNRKNAFTDLDDCIWACEAIEYLSDKKVISGKAEGIFDPYATTTRAEFIKMVVLAFGFREGVYDGTFSDVDSDDWFAPYVASAYASGIANGSEGLFMPYNLISRQDMAVLLYRAKGMKASVNEKNVFTDSHLISDYAKSAVYAMYEKGIALGMGDGTFAPLKNATRAEAAQMIYKMISVE